MPDNAMAESQPSSRGVPSEVRIGLAMSGAIALVLYEAGVTHEVFRLAKAWDTRREERATGSTTTVSGSEGYHECLRAIPMHPVIDILTGASAGAVNSTLLASCLAGGTDFVRYHKALLTTLDVETLKYDKNDAPHSLLDSRVLLKVLNDELQKNVEANSESEEESEIRCGKAMDLCVRLCRTHLAGHCETTRDAIGHQIDVETRSDVIEFSGEDFLNYAKIPKIAEATLASAAFPGVFGPVCDQTDKVWYVDGGLWDNQPVDWAVDAVKDKPAFLRTHRCILFVEPNPPGRRADRAKPGGEKEPGLTEILMAIPFMGVKGNVWPAISDLLDYNRRSRVYNRVVREPGLRTMARQLGRKWLADSHNQIDSAATFARSLENGDWKNAEPSTPTILNQVRLETVLFDSDPALIQRWHAINEAWNALHLRLDTGAREDLLFSDKQLGSEENPTPALTAALAALGGVGWYDMRRRAVRRRIDMVNDTLNTPHRSTGPDGGDPNIARKKYALYLQLERLNDYLYAYADPAALPPESAQASGERPRDAGTTDWPSYHSRLVRFHSRFRTATVQMLNDLEFAFRYLFRVPAIANAADEQRRAIEDILSDRSKNPLLALAKWVDAITEEANVAREVSGVDRGSTDASGDGGRDSYVRKLLDCLRPMGVSTADAIGLASANRWAERTRFTSVDVMRHVLASVSDLSNKRAVDLVRVSPNDTNNLYLITCDDLGDQTPAVRKLAGEGLGHLQGFLEERWRRNDYIWGRLDACEILLRTMRLYAEREGNVWTEKEYEEALFNAQNAILTQEAELYYERLSELGTRARRKWSIADARKATDELSRVMPRSIPCGTPGIGAIHRPPMGGAEKGDKR